MTMMTLVSLCLLICVLATTTTTTNAFAGVGPSSFLGQPGRQTWSTRATTTTRRDTVTSLYSFALLVEMEINPDRMEEFLEKIEFNAVNSRKEPQCQRFDVLRDQDDPNKFIFYEIYDTKEGLDFHREQDHFKQWTEFRDSDGVVSRKSWELDGEFMT